MQWFTDLKRRKIRFTIERKNHIKVDHPEMSEQINKIKKTLLNPDTIIKSKTDQNVELFYKLYEKSPVTEKYLCVVVKILDDDVFIITAFFTDTIKKGEILWEKK